MPRRPASPLQRKRSDGGDEDEYAPDGDEDEDDEEEELYDMRGVLRTDNDDDDDDEDQRRWSRDRVRDEVGSESEEEEEEEDEEEEDELPLPTRGADALSSAVPWPVAAKAILRAAEEAQSKEIGNLLGHLQPLLKSYGFSGSDSVWSQSHCVINVPPRFPSYWEYWGKDTKKADLRHDKTISKAQDLVSYLEQAIALADTGVDLRLEKEGIKPKELLRSVRKWGGDPKNRKKLLDPNVVDASCPPNAPRYARQASEFLVELQKNSKGRKSLDDQDVKDLLKKYRFTYDTSGTIVYPPDDWGSFYKAWGQRCCVSKQSSPAGVNNSRQTRDVRSLTMLIGYLGGMLEVLRSGATLPLQSELGADFEKGDRVRVKKVGVEPANPPPGQSPPWPDPSLQGKLGTVTRRAGPGWIHVRFDGTSAAMPSKPCRRWWLDKVPAEGGN